MVRRVGVLVLLVAVLAACSSTPVAHWRGSGERVVQVRLNPSVVEPHVALAVVNAAQLWSDGVDRLRVEVSWGVCSFPPIGHCIDVVQEHTDGYTSHGSDTLGHMFGRAGYIAFGYGYSWEWALFVGCHEGGHAFVGLGHSPHGLEGPCDYDTHGPTAYDLQLANAMYAHDD